jgi:dTDP-3,4-didehydro-2,6-dideoxy-alpha-D-glucose 3-reductase
MKPLRIGIMGCADISRRRMIPAMVASPVTEVTAVASRDPAKAAALAAITGCRPVSGYARLLELADVDAVYIPLPPALRADWIEAALRAGKHVLAEKPVSTEPRRTRELIGLARASGLALSENVMFVHHRQHAAVLQLLAENAIGEVRAFSAAFGIPALPEGNIRYVPELGGGALWDLGIYPIRAALHVLGAELSVTGAVSAALGHDVDTSWAVLLSGPAGVGVQLTFGFDQMYHCAYTVLGSHGRLTVDRAFTPPSSHVPVLTLENAGGTRPIRLEADDQVVNSVAAFESAARTGHVPAAETVLREAELLDEIARHSGRAMASTGERSST